MKTTFIAEWKSSYWGATPTSLLKTFLLAGLLLGACKKDEWPSIKAKGRDLVFVEWEGKKYLYGDGFFTRRARRVDMMDWSDKDVQLRRNNLMPGNKSYTTFRLYVNRHRKNTTFPFRGVFYFDIDTTLPNFVDTVRLDMMSFYVNGFNVSVSSIASFATRNFILTKDAILLDGDMVVNYLDPDSLRLNNSSYIRTQTVHFFVDKDISD